MYIFLVLETAVVTSHKLDNILKNLYVFDIFKRYEFITENNITKEHIESVDDAASATLSTKRSDNEMKSVFFVLLLVVSYFINFLQKNAIIIEDNKCDISNLTPSFFELSIPLPTATRIKAGPAFTQ